MALSIFDDKSHPPTSDDLIGILGVSHSWWDQIEIFVRAHYPAATEEWKHPGAKWGWGYRLKDRKRVIIYLSPDRGFFRVAMVFSEKMVQQVLDSDVSGELKTLLKEATVYTEGRGIRWELRDAGQLPDVEKLILIKLSK